MVRTKNHKLRAAEKVQVQQSKLNINAGAVTFFAIFLFLQKPVVSVNAHIMMLGQELLDPTWVCL